MSFGLIGEKLSHSYSPLIHTMLGYYDYKLFEIEKDQLGDFIKNGDYNGLNVTVPYKKEAMKYVECDSVSSKLGAINTIYRKDGKLHGTNTDYFGFMYMLSLHQINLQGKKVLILGSGGASSIVYGVCKMCEASKIFIASRKKSTEYVSYNNLPTDVDVIINTTPVGMYPNTDVQVIDLVPFKNCKTVIDLIYNPYRTRLLQQAEELGMKTVSGLSMLVAQATKAANHFIGINFIQHNRQILHNLKAYCLNITLIGMPGCGKTIIGEKLANETGRKFVDIDTEIEKTDGRSISEIFSQEGEIYFRNLETEILKKYCRESNLVIATGGGSILREENRKIIKENSGVVLINRPLEKISAQNRPLVPDKNALYSLYDERKDIYKKISDITVDNNKEDNNFNIIIDEILNKLGGYYETDYFNN